MDPEQAREPAQRGQLGRLFLAWLAPVRSHPERVDLGAEPLGGPPRAPQDSLRLRLRLDQGEDPLGDGLPAEWLEGRRVPPRLDVLGDLAQHELAQRGQVLLPEEVVQRDLGALARIDLACPQPLMQLLRREVDEHDLVRLVQEAVGEGLAHAHPGQLEDRVVEALEVLDVDRRDDVDPGVQDLLDVLVALLVAHRRARSCGRARRPARAPACARSRRRCPSPRARAAPCAVRRRGTTSRPSASAAVSGRSCGSR